MSNTETKTRKTRTTSLETKAGNTKASNKKSGFKKTDSKKTGSKKTDSKKSNSKKTTSKQITKEQSTREKRLKYITASFNTKTHRSHVPVPVLDKEGKPLFVTTDNKKVRHLLTEHKAFVRYRVPFAIQLFEDVPGFEKQDYALGIDPGVANIGVAVINDKTAEVVYKANFETRTPEVKVLMLNRKMYRRLRRRHQRLIKRKLAVRSNFKLKNKVFFLKYKKTDEKSSKNKKSYSKILCKNMRGYPAQFQNRRHKEGWLTPTAYHCLLTHLNLIKKLNKFYNITTICIENNCFDFQKLENRNISKWQYQKGTLYGYRNAFDYLSQKQHGHCLLCDSPIEHYHHIVPRSHLGSDTVNNLVGLCYSCHARIHAGDAALIERLESEKYGCKAQIISTLNIIMKRLLETIQKDFSDKTLFVQYGYKTKQIREANHLSKEHYNDALSILIGCLNLASYKDNTIPGIMMQVRRHNRAKISSLTNRFYYADVLQPDGTVKQEKVATNRHKATGQTTPSLAEYLAPYKTDEAKCKAAANLHVIKGKRSYYTGKNPHSRGNLVCKLGVKHRMYSVIKGDSAGFYLITGSKQEKLTDYKQYAYHQLYGIIVA